MVELTLQQVDAVAGGATVAGGIAMVVAGVWVGGVMGFGIGTMFPGAGNIAGAIAGGVIGLGAGIGFVLADAT